MTRQNQSGRQRNSKKRRISVVISGMPSVGKTTAAETISRKFHLKHIAGGDMLREMAIQRGYNPVGANWWDAEEGMKFLAERKTNPDFDKEVDRRLIQYVKKGGVVITSYTVPWLCKDGLKIWFKASQRARAVRLAGRDKIGLKEAVRIVQKRDIRNRKLYSRIYHIEFGRDLSVFNYTIDTEKMNAEEVAEAASDLVYDYKKNT